MKYGISFVLGMCLVGAAWYGISYKNMPPSIPEVCELGIEEVCDKNGVHYSTPCEAKNAGLSPETGEVKKDFCIVVPQNEGTSPTTYTHGSVGFSYPSEWKIDSEKTISTYTNGTAWYRAEFVKSDGKNILRFEENPDGYGPFGWKKVYTLKNTEDGTVTIDTIKEIDPGTIPSKVIDYAVRLKHGNENYLWMFGSDNAADELLFQNFLKSITVKKAVTETVSLNCTGEKITQSTYSFCLPKNHTWKRENNVIQLSHTSTEDTITLADFSGKKYINEDSKFGNTTLTYNPTKATWESSMPNKILTTSKGLKVFIGSERWLTYIVPIDGGHLIILNSTGGGNTEPLKELIQSFTFTSR